MIIFLSIFSFFFIAKYNHHNGFGVQFLAIKSNFPCTFLQDTEFLDLWENALHYNITEVKHLVCWNIIWYQYLDFEVTSGTNINIIPWFILKILGEGDDHPPSLVVLGKLGLVIRVLICVGKVDSLWQARSQTRL